MLASKVEIDVCIQAPAWDASARVWVSPPLQKMHFGRKMVRNAVNIAFLNALTVLFLCIPAAYQQWERRSPSK